MIDWLHPTTNAHVRSWHIASLRCAVEFGRIGAWRTSIKLGLQVRALGDAPPLLGKHQAYLDLPHAKALGLFSCREAQSASPPHVFELRGAQFRVAHR